MGDLKERLRDFRIQGMQPPITGEAADRIEALERALREIAAYGDTQASDILAASGSYSAFDEPCSVGIARQALGEGQ